MFCRGLSPRGRWLCRGPPWRWMSSKRDIPIYSPWECGPAGPWGRRGGPWSRRWGPRRDWWGFPSPSNFMAHMERDLEEMGRRFQQMGSPWFGIPRASTGRTARNEASEVQVSYTDKELEIRLNVEQFTPEELNVKVVDNNLVISGKHQEKADEFGHVTREFTRQFLIPEDCDPESVICSFEEEGILNITARVKNSEPSSERIINIERKGQKEGDGSKEEDRQERTNYIYIDILQSAKRLY